ncbi:hypothetical protein [Nitrosomonas cryotolerans]|nr:hypothetical protein [Nitrosomonas cryotolerans]
MSVSIFFMLVLISIPVSAETNLSFNTAQSPTENYLLAYADKTETGDESSHGSRDSVVEPGEKHKYSGKCSGMSRVDLDKDGKISKKEFMQHHERMFEKKDINKDGFIDKEESRKMMHHKHKHGHMGDKTQGDMEQ